MTGTEITTHHGLEACPHCAERCWFQIQGCVGFVTTAAEAHLKGSCTYYSEITGAVPEGSVAKLAYVKEAVLPVVTPAPPACDPYTCGHMSNWPKPTQLCMVKSFDGLVIAEHVGVPMCACAERCWFQLAGCIGFITDALGDEAGTCTYYSSITSTSGLGTGRKRAMIQEGALEGPGGIGSPAPGSSGPSLEVILLGFAFAAFIVVVCIFAVRGRRAQSAGFTEQRDVENAQAVELS